MRAAGVKGRALYWVPPPPTPLHPLAAPLFSSPACCTSRLTELHKGLIPGPAQARALSQDQPQLLAAAVRTGKEAGRRGREPDLCLPTRQRAARCSPPDLLTFPAAGDRSRLEPGEWLGAVVGL